MKGMLRIEISRTKDMAIFEELTKYCFYHF